MCTSQKHHSIPVGDNCREQAVNSVSEKQNSRLAASSSVSVGQNKNSFEDSFDAHVLRIL